MPKCNQSDPIKAPGTAMAHHSPALTALRFPALGRTRPAARTRCMWAANRGGGLHDRVRKRLQALARGRHRGRRCHALDRRELMPWPPQPARSTALPTAWSLRVATACALPRPLRRTGLRLDGQPGTSRGRAQSVRCTGIQASRVRCSPDVGPEDLKARGSLSGAPAVWAAGFAMIAAASS